MTRKEFLTELDRRLASLPKEEADRHLLYYAEILADRIEDGMTEDEAVADMESLDTIAARILAQQYTAPKPPAINRRALAIVVTIIAIALSLTIIGGLSVRHLVFENVVSNESVPIITPVVEADEYCSIEIPSDGIRNIDITWIADSISFMVWDENSIMLETCGLPPYEVIGDTLTIKQNENTPSVSSSLFITLPRTLAEQTLNELRISVTSADIYLSEINAKTLDLTTLSGNSDISGTFITVDISSSSGDVFFIGGTERGSFDMVSGMLSITAETAPQNLQIDSVSGDVFLSLPDDAGYHVEFDSVSGTLYGDNYVSGRDPAEIQVDTISGDLSISNY